MTMIAEGAEAKRAEDALAERKRKMEEKERWEGTVITHVLFLDLASLAWLSSSSFSLLTFRPPPTLHRNARGPRFGLAEFQQEKEETDQRSRSARLIARVSVCSGTSAFRSTCCISSMQAMFSRITRVYTTLICDHAWKLQ